MVSIKDIEDEPTYIQLLLVPWHDVQIYYAPYYSSSQIVILVVVVVAVVVVVVVAHSAQYSDDGKTNLASSLTTSQSQ
jgi:hypothetical protein